MFNSFSGYIIIINNLRAEINNLYFIKLIGMFYNTIILNFKTLE